VSRASRDPVLILCSPRSCSTVICAMLGQHPQLYGFPELNLFVTETLGELWSYGNSQSPGASSYITGLLRVVAEMEFGAQTEETIRRAKQWVSTRLHWTSTHMLDELLTWVQPRSGIEKSPRTSLSERSIGRALSAYPRARIIHLTRHPISTLRSLHENHRHAEPGKPSSADSVWLFNFYARLWILSQELIVSVVRRLSPSQALQVHAEDLLGDSDVNLQRLAKWLNVASDAQTIQAMKHPERSPYARPAPMGLDGEGDPHFLQNPQLRLLTSSEALPLPAEWSLAPSIVTRVSELSRLLGYELIA